MSKMTLLEIVQEILNDMDSDEVNSIDDTVESSQVANIVKSTYRAMLSDKDWPHTKRLLQLEPSGDNNLPTHVTIQDDVKRLCFVNYDIARRDQSPKKIFREVKYVDQDNFLRYLNGRDNTQAYISTIIDPSSGIELLIRNDQPPKYFTSFDDEVLIFDAYDSLLDNTIQAHKIQAYAYVYPKWYDQENFIPDLPIHAFTALVEEAKSRASLKLRQQADQKAEQESQRQRRWLSRNANKVAGGTKYATFGRNPGYAPLYRGYEYRDPTFRRDD